MPMQGSWQRCRTRAALTLLKISWLSWNAAWEMMPEEVKAFWTWLRLDRYEATAGQAQVAPGTITVLGLQAGPPPKEVEDPQRPHPKDPIHGLSVL